MPRLIGERMFAGACMTLMLIPQFALSQTSGITQFEDKAEWQNASANISSITFDRPGAPDADIDRGYPDGLSTSGVKFSALPGQRVSNYLFVRRAASNFLYGAGDTDLGCQQPHGPCGSGAGISVILPPGTTSIGLDLGAMHVPGVIVTFSDNEVFSVPNAPASQQNSAFAGFISSRPLQSFKVQAAGLPIIRSISFGNASGSAPPLVSRARDNPERTGHSVPVPDIPRPYASPRVATMSLDDARTKVKQTRQQIDNLLASVPTVPPKDMFETTADYQRRRQGAQKTIQAQLDSLTSSLSALKSQYFPAANAKPAFQSYDADSGTLRAAIPSLNRDLTTAWLSPADARAMHQDWDNVAFASGYSEEGERDGPGALLWRGKIITSLDPSENRTFRSGGGVSAPAVIAKVDPEMSEEARKAKYSGSVMLSLVVSPEGKATQIHVVKGAGMGLNEKAVEAVQKWTFKPGMKDGQPVPARATIEINFRPL